MGWKSVKDHYRITHIVHVRGERICIGSAFISDLIVVTQDGKCVKRQLDDGSANLARYQREFDADPELLRRLIAQKDVFGPPITVYTYDGAKILEKQCEATGYPNVTFDGDLMYENRFSTDKAAIVRIALENAWCGVAAYERRIDEVRVELSKLEADLARCASDLSTLAGEYPEIAKAAKAVAG